MVCDHKQLRCTNNVYYCTLCGAVVHPEAADDLPFTDKPDAPETAKKPAKRKTTKREVATK